MNQNTRGTRRWPRLLQVPNISLAAAAWLLVMASVALWHAYLVCARGFDMPLHPFLTLSVLGAGGSAWGFRLAGATPRAFHLLLVPLGGVGCWLIVTSPVGRDLPTMVGAGLSTIWIAAGVSLMGSLSDPLRRAQRTVAMAASLLLAAAFAMLLRSAGVDGHGVALLRLPQRWAANSAAATERQRRAAPPLIGVWQPPSEWLEGEFRSYRGGDGSVPRVFPKESKPVEVWRTPVGAAWSGMVVANGMVFLHEQQGGEERVRCLGLGGSERWCAVKQRQFEHPLSGPGPRATPLLAAGNVFTVGGDGLLQCRRQTDGVLIWSVDILKDAGAEPPQHGVAGSPLHVDDMIVVAPGGAAAAVAAYDAAGGRLLWQAGDGQASYASPALMTLGGRRQIVVVHARSVAGYSPQGERLWTRKFENHDGTNASQPLAVGKDQLLISSGYGRGAELLDLSHGEPTRVWTSRRPQTKFTSGVIRNGHLYALDNGVLCCVDLSNGVSVWRRGRYGHGQLLLAEDLLLIQCESGELATVDASPDAWRERNRWPALDGRTWNTPCLAGRWLLIRNDREAACLKFSVVSGE